MNAAMHIGQWILATGCLLAAGMQLAALRSPDVRESEVACALRTVKVAGWGLLGARLVYLLWTVGEVPISFLALAPLLLLAYADTLWPLVRLAQHDATDTRITAPGELDSLPHDQWSTVFGRGKDTP